MKSKSWLDHRIWHTTSGGQRNFVKIGSLPPSERKQYQYIRHRYEAFTSDDNTGSPQLDDELITTYDKFITLYVAFKNAEGIDGLDRSDLCIATNNPMVAMDLDAEYGVSVVHNIPSDAVVKYIDLDESMDDWVYPPVGFSEDELLEYFQKGSDKKFVLDLYEYKDQLYIEEEK